MLENLFEKIKKVSPQGKEFWSARDLYPLLGYVRWENFEVAIGRAKEACKNSGQKVVEHLREVTKSFVSGQGAKRDFIDYNLSRYACYLIAQNGDPRKEEIALAQTYFVIKTRQKEVEEGLMEDYKRVHLLEVLKGKTKDLLFDNIGSEELSANWFRATQADAKIRRENIFGEKKASNTHKKAGEIVRKAIKDFGGTMPEELPKKDNIKNSKKRIKSTQKNSAILEK